MSNSEAKYWFSSQECFKGNMSRTASCFFLLLALLVLLLYIYQSTSVDWLVVKSHYSLHGSTASDTSLSFDKPAGVDKSISSDMGLKESSSDSRLNDISRSESNVTTGGLVQVIVLARMRTGSTLCGEVMNQNPELFFIFEPLHALKYLRLSEDEDATDEDYQIEYSNLLQKLYKCKFPRTFIQSIARWGIGKGKSAGLLPICKQTDGCRNASPSQLQRRCEKSGHVATKTIRGDIKMLRPLVKVHGINMKVIHLMRDPRGTASSRRSYYAARPRGMFSRTGSHKQSLEELELLSTESTKNTIPKLCDWMKETLNDALERPKWLRYRYKLVRYEDLAMEPLRLSREIYNFIGLEMPPTVVNWVKENTESSNSISKRQFSTHKNSSQAATSWRQKLSLKEVLQVQELCGDVMESLGYELINSQADLEDSSVSVVKPISLGKDIMIT